MYSLDMSRLFFIGGMPWWLVLIAAMGAVVLLATQWLGLKSRLGPYRRSLLVALRGLVYGLLIFFLLGPGLVEQQTTRLRRPLTILVDVSQSMGLPAGARAANSGAKASRSRLDIVKEALSAGEVSSIQKLAQHYDLSLYQFGTNLEPITPAMLSQLEARGKGTRLLESLREAGQKQTGGVIVFSDGIANGEEPGREGPSFPAPVFTVGVGETEGFTDIRIASLSSPEFAFRGREVKMGLSIQAHGLAGKTVPLYFNRGSNLITSRSIVVDRDPFEQEITLSYTPRETGPQSFTLRLSPQAGEAIVQNNQKDFKIDVRRDKIRILTLSGSPSWNYRFLRMALKQDPRVELVSFVFLRTPVDSVDVPDNQLSLIPFPIDEIFSEELKNFDVIVFDDFSYRSYFNAIYLEKVREFVRDGGGLAMFGGIRSFDNGGYSESPLGELLPVEGNGKGGYQTGTSLRTLLTRAGRAHPVTRLVPGLEANEEAWKKMPPLTRLNPVRGAKGETLLLARPESGGGEFPLLTVGQFGKGRTLALMSDDIWRWNFITVGQQESSQNHLKLIRQSVRWLAQEPSLNQVQIVSGTSTWRPGEKQAVKVRVLKEDFTPTANAAVRVRVTGPEGEVSALEAIPEMEEGDYSAEWSPIKEGPYLLEAEAHLGGRLLGKDRQSFVVSSAYQETENGRPRPDLLKQIAETSRGDFIPIQEWNDDALKRISAKLENLMPSGIVEQRQILLWNSRWIFALLLALLGSEWWLRRRWGLV